MRSFLLAAALLLPTLALAQKPVQPDLAPTPPMGWNSWDAYGVTIDETSFRANAVWIAKNLKPFGYQYVTIDEGWYEPRASAASNSSEQLVLDQYGRFIPAVDRFPSAANGAGFAPLADYLHSLGLKFGIHVLQGIPKKAVADNSPIEGSTFHAKEAANTAASCQWDTKTWDLQENDAAQAYYDSIVRLYASWHVDLIKIDCISSRPYKGEEIRMFHEAILKSGAPMTLSLSPGAAPLNEAANLRQYSQQWRISDDVWDVWQSTGAFPQGVNDQIARAAKWLPYAGIVDGQGHWPDSDMLPIGNLSPSPGWGKPRASNLTPDEQRSMIDLWSIVRSPLVYGGDPVTTDAATLALLTNPEVLAIDQHSHNNKAAILTHDLAVYTAEPGAAASKFAGGTYVAVFNREDKPQEVTLTLAQLGIPVRPSVVIDLWKQGSRTPTAKEIHLTLAPHASAMLVVAPAAR